MQIFYAQIIEQFNPELNSGQSPKTIHLIENLEFQVRLRMNGIMLV
jgi:hypothetical protein